MALIMRASEGSAGEGGRETVKLPFKRKCD